MRLRLYVDIDYPEPVTPTQEAHIRANLSDVVHEIARDDRFNAAGKRVITMACAVAKIVPNPEPDPKAEFTELTDAERADLGPEPSGEKA